MYSSFGAKFQMDNRLDTSLEFYHPAERSRHHPFALSGWLNRQRYQYATTMYTPSPMVNTHAHGDKNKPKRLFL
jgi:hypothetical protein